MFLIILLLRLCCAFQREEILAVLYQSCTILADFPPFQALKTFS